MLKAIVTTKNPAFWIILHLVLGLVFSVVPFLFIIWFLIFVLTSIGNLTTGDNRSQSVYLIQLISYLGSAELIGRMTKAYKYGLPWEYGKYVVFFGFLYSMVVLGNRRGIIGFFLVLLLLPSLFFHPVLEFRYNELIFNGLGPLSVAIAIIAAYKCRITKLEFKQVLKLLLYPAIMVLAFTVIRTPDLDSIEFSLNANFETAGGYGSNQVSTVLGIGLLISFIFFMNKWDLTGYRMLDLFLIGFFGFQGLITFSRGGVFGAVLGIIIVIFFFSSASYGLKTKYKIPAIGKYVLPTIISLATIWFVANAVTGGILLQRYSGETSSTIAGHREVDVNTLTSGRVEIATREFQIWGDYFMFGAGLGSSKYIRTQEEYGSGEAAAPHVELSRLAAEHGLMGMLYFLILIVMGAKLYKRNTNPKYQSILVVLFVVGIYTTFHAAMRTYVTPLFIGLSMLQIQGINDREEDESLIKKKLKIQN